MHIAIAGNIGCGKTTLTSMLAQQYGWNAEYESVENNPYLKDFYGDMNRWSFHLQVYFLNNRFNQITQIRESGQKVVQDRTIYEDAHIFATNLYKSGKLSKRDFDNYMTLFKAMTRYIQAPDLLIYLRADLPKLQKQIRLRGRDYENSISPEYLANLNDHYEDWINQYDLGKLLILDVNNMDYANNPDDFAFVKSQIEEHLAEEVSLV